MFIDPEQFEFVPYLESNWLRIREEYLTLPEDVFEPWGYSARCMARGGVCTGFMLLETVTTGRTHPISNNKMNVDFHSEQE